MKTIYTLLLAFGLCFTVHAQNIVSYQNLSSQEKNEIDLLSKSDQNRLLLQFGFPTKLLANDNQGIKILDVVGSQSINNEILEGTSEGFSKVELIIISDLTNESLAISTLNLENFGSIKYLLITSNEMLSNAFVVNLLSNVQLPSNIVVVYKQNVLM